jgi:pimeloyl-ACP methyl ester carboxylesterase
MLGTLVIGYALLVLVAVLIQRRLIYFPTKLFANVAEQIAAQNGFTPWRNPTGDTIGWKLAANGTPIGIVLVTHGNAGCALDRDYLAKPIHDGLPLDVFILEYPGYGARGGAPSMSSILAAAEEAFDALPKDKPIFLVSESIGAGAVAHLAKTRPDRVKGLALFVPYDDLASVGQASMPFLPVKLLMRDRFQPARWLENYHGPVKVVLAGADEVIPTRFGQRLFDSYKGPKNLQIVPRARHNDVAGQSPEWWKEVFGFWQQINSAAP